MGCQWFPPSRIQLRGWEVGPGFAFQAGGVILRCPVAANVLAANGGEASKFTSAAESKCTEHLLMNESAAH